MSDPHITTYQFIIWFVLTVTITSHFGRNVYSVKQVETHLPLYTCIICMTLYYNDVAFITRKAGD